jgi:hypothetical protein
MPWLNGVALTASALVVSIGWLPFLGGFALTEMSAAAAQALVR